MKSGVPVAPQAGRDRVVTIAMMVVRTGFVAAAVLGIGMMFHLWSRGQVVPFHMLIGAVTLVGMLVTAVRVIMLGKVTALMLGAGLLLGTGSAVGVLLDAAPGLLHFLLMVLAVGFAEINAALLKRAR